MTITTAQIYGVIRWVLALVGGGTLVKEMSADQVNSLISNIATLIGAAATIASLIWSWWSNHPSQLASQLAQAKNPLVDGR